ncbi:MAG: TetR/AcrR family transcriptional regulator C-terminal domain-containing protein [Chloroflexi bacterium]|nr:TetR/AcrR family transcriptional regulator C-terminal domain-containing protein [Chloroflexota bacterium]
MADPSDALHPDLDPLPQPPWRRLPPGRAAPRLPLTRDLIVDAALRVLDREGVDALSMHRVAAELGTGAASLYGHVRNKDELLQLLSERVGEEIELPAPDPDHWQDQLKEVLRQIRGATERHRDVARISLGRLPSGPVLARFTEWLFALMVPVGIPDQVIAHTGDLTSLYVQAYAFEESLGVASPTGEPLPPEQIVTMLRDYLLSLPGDRFPQVHRAVDVLFGGDRDARFEFGIDLIVRGLGTYAVPPSPPRRLSRRSARSP